MKRLAYVYAVAIAAFVLVAHCGVDQDRGGAPDTRRGLDGGTIGAVQHFGGSR